MHGAVEVCDCLDQRRQRAKAVEERASRLNELEVVEHTVVASEGQGAHHALDAVRPVEGDVSGRKTENKRKNNSHKPVQRISDLSALLQLVDDGLPLVERQIGFRLQHNRHSADDRLQLHRRRDDLFAQVLQERGLVQKHPVLDLQGGQLLLDRRLRQRACQRHQNGGSSRQEAELLLHVLDPLLVEQKRRRDVVRVSRDQLHHRRRMDADHSTLAALGELLHIHGPDRDLVVDTGPEPCLEMWG